MSEKDQNNTHHSSTSTLDTGREEHPPTKEKLSNDVEKQEQPSENKESTAISPPPPPAWDGASDAANPINFSKSKKIVILAVICSCCLCVTCASSVITTVFEDIQRDLSVSEEVAILTLSLFVLGLSVAPLGVSPFSELYGRRPIYVISFGWFFLLGFPVAFANNIAVLCIFRFLTGLAGAAFLTVAGGTISDMWLPKDMFMPMAFFTASAFLGPVVGPVYGSFIAQFTTEWRWTMWVITIWTFIDLLLVLTVTPETYAPVILAKKAKLRQKETGISDAHLDKRSQVSLIGMITDNIKKIPLLLFYEPMLTILCVWTGILLSIIYAFFEIFPIVFTNKGLNTYQGGLCFLGIMVSNFLAVCTMPYFKKRLASQADPKTGMPSPEARLDCAKIGCFLSPMGLFIFAFTSYKNIHWIAAVIGSGVFGMGCYYLFFSIFMYTTANWRPVAASAMGANSTVRCLMATAFPLFTVQMVNRLSVPGAVGLLAGLNCLMIPVPFVLTRYGTQIRARSRYTLKA